MGKNYFSLLYLALLLLAGCASSKDVMTTTAEEPVPPPVVEAEAAEVEPAPVVDESEEMLDRWMHLAGNDGAYVGIGTDRAYGMLLEGRQPAKKVIVAVIDSGVDVEHEDITVWMNADEVPDNGRDDDNNGYVDDVYGWNFIGGADGENVYFDTFEVTREYARLRRQFEGVDPGSLAGEEREQYTYFQEIEAAFNKELQEMTNIYGNIEQAAQLWDAANSIMADFLETESFTMEQVYDATSDREDVGQAKNILTYFDQMGLTREQLLKEMATFEGYLEKGLNPEFDPRGIVGDNYEDASEKYYGNNDVTGPDAYHGTHVAGIIGARRDNAVGIDGIANHVEIMAIRAVPKGDERDKDIANAIRYAVDNGADIINMSFGKSYSPYKTAVDEAVKYAESNDVLMIHAAGNDGVNNDSTRNYPTSRFLDGRGNAGAWVEVGASSWEGPQKLAASFSNYGKMNVDVFAPGVDIYSTVPGNAYDRANGTSMASPVVAGLAALILSYYPQFSASEVKEILLASATSYAEQMVTKPGTESTMVAFGALSRTGAIINAYTALTLAEEKAKAE